MPGSMDQSAAPKEKWVRFRLRVPPELDEALSNFLTEMGAQGVFEEYLEPGISDLPEPEAKDEHVLNAYFPSDADDAKRAARLQAYIDSLAELFPDKEKPVFDTEAIVDPQWSEVWKRYFKPLRISKNIIVKPSWERYSATGRETVVEIDPGMAFGTGQHASTRMCLGAIEDLLLKDRTFPRWRMLDVGTGTGILGIAGAKLGADHVVCVDTDKKAVEIARENSEINEVCDRVEIRNKDVQSIHESFELIVANLTAKILLKVRSHLLSLLQRNGYLVISGLIDQDRSDIETHFLVPPLAVHNTISEKEWCCYVLKKGENGR